jgi:hypothetical protein
MHHNLLLFDIRHCIGLSRCCGFGWRLELEHLELLLESGDHRCPLLKLEVLLLDGVLKVYNHVGVGVHLLMGEVKLLVVVVPPVLSLTEAVVCDLQLTVLVRRCKCTTAEDGILMPQPLDVLPVCGQPQMLLDDGLSSAVLQVQQVLHVPGHLSHTGVEVRALRVGHGHKALLPHGVLLIMNQEERGRHLSGGGEAALT